MTYDKYIFGNGTVNVYVDGIAINGVKEFGIPIPDMNTLSAFLIYDSFENDPGQMIIDVSAHKSNEIHEYKISVSDYYTWIYYGKITGYRLTIDSVVSATVKIELCGKFNYRCGTEEVNRVIDLIKGEDGVR